MTEWKSDLVDILNGIKTDLMKTRDKILKDNLLEYSDPADRDHDAHCCWVDALKIEEIIDDLQAANNRPDKLGECLRLFFEVADSATFCAEDLRPDLMVNGKTVLEHFALSGANLETCRNMICDSDYMWAQTLQEAGVLRKVAGKKIDYEDDGHGL